MNRNHTYYDLLINSYALYMYNPFSIIYVYRFDIENHRVLIAKSIMEIFSETIFNILIIVFCLQLAAAQNDEPGDNVRSGDWHPR